MSITVLEAKQLGILQVLAAGMEEHVPSKIKQTTARATVKTAQSVSPGQKDFRDEIADHVQIWGLLVGIRSTRKAISFGGQESIVVRLV